MQYYLAFSTCPDEASARRLAQGLVGEHLAACVNMVPGLTSIYPWQGKIEQSQEWLLLIKTQQDALEALKAYLEDHHPYELPEIIAVPIEQALPDYLKWISAWVKSKT